MRLRASLLILGLLAFASAGLVCEAQPLPEPLPGTVKFSKDKLTLNDALAEMQMLTDNVVVDRRTNKTNPELTFKSKTGLYWEMLDAIGTQGVGFSAYQEGGGVALVDAPYRKLQTDYSSIFRFVVKRVTVTRDDETQAHTCQVSLDAAWEPRFQLLYLNLNEAEVRFGKQHEKVERQSARPVAGVSATEIELTTKAPPRVVAEIAALKGTIRVIGAPKMLEFAFDKLDVKPIVKEGVEVRLSYVNKKSNRWTVEVLSEYPSGAIVPLESFQSWMDNNRVWLSFGMDPKTKRPYELEPSGQSPQDSKTGTKIRYEFTPRGDVPLPALNANVTLRQRTPNRVVAFTVPFKFEHLPLP